MFSASAMNKAFASELTTSKGCIRITRLWVNRRGQIEEGSVAVGDWKGRGVIVFAGQQIKTMKDLI